MTEKIGKSLSRSPDAKPLRIGVLCNQARLTAWQLKCLETVEQLGFVEISLLVCNKAADVQRPPVYRRLRDKLASGLLLWRVYERLFLENRSAACKESSIPAAMANVPTIEVAPICIGKFRQAFDTSSLEALRKYDLDVLLRFGFGILTGEILTLPRYGIWSFHHGDAEHYRGAPPGFWEIHNGDPVTGVILQRLSETLDGGTVLHSGWFKTNAADYSKSLDRILFGAAHFVSRALTELQQDPEGLLKRNPLEKSGPIYRYPRTRSMLTFFGKTAAAKIRNQYKALFRHQQWSVGILDNSAAEIFEQLSGRRQRIGRVSWLREPRGRFLADPFAVTINGETLIMAEEFDWRAGRGHISVVSKTAKGISLPRAVIRLDHHLSYPYTCDYNGESYCVPECSQTNGVLLYRLVRGERRFVEQRRLIEGFPAVDPTIFSHEGRWWLFCTSAEAGPNEFLHAWFADEITGEWQPHAANPLKVDIRAARPAGTPFYHHGALIRPAQDCSQIYGGAITFNRVLKLTPEEFSEEPAGQLLPDPAHYPAGLHTISPLGNQTVVDGARLKFVPSEFWRAFANLHRTLLR